MQPIIPQMLREHLCANPQIKEIYFNAVGEWLFFPRAAFPLVLTRTQALELPLAEAVPIAAPFIAAINNIANTETMADIPPHARVAMVPVVIQPSLALATQADTLPVNVQVQPSAPAFAVQQKAPAVAGYSYTVPSVLPQNMPFVALLRPIAGQQPRAGP